MKKKPLAGWLLISGILIASAVLKFGYFGRSRELTEKERFEKVLSLDRRFLHDKDASDVDVYGALVRLALALDPLARSEALVRAKASSTLVRSGAANALGY